MSRLEIERPGVLKGAGNLRRVNLDALSTLSLDVEFLRVLHEFGRFLRDLLQLRMLRVLPRIDFDFLIGDFLSVRRLVFHDGAFLLRSTVGDILKRLDQQLDLRIQPIHIASFARPLFVDASAEITNDVSFLVLDGTGVDTLHDILPRFVRERTHLQEDGERQLRIRQTSQFHDTLPYRNNRARQSLRTVRASVDSVPHSR